MASPFENKPVLNPRGKPKISFGQIQLKKPEPESDQNIDGEGINESPQVVGGFSSFSYSKPESTSAADASDSVAKVENEEDDQMNRVMGFSSFDSSKKEVKQKKSARNFDVKEMAEAIRKSKIQKRTEKAVSQIMTPGSDDDDDDDLETRIVDPGVKSQGNQDDDEEDTFKKPKATTKPGGSDDDDISSDDDEDKVRPAFPTKHKRVLTHGAKPVTALAIDPAATRFATGSIDYEVKLWDFTGLKNGHAFRALKPCESHLIKNLSYSLNGESLLIIGGNCQAKVVDRDGGELLECIKGDQYIVDMSQTKGHVAALTGGQFNPKQKEIFLTCSDDGTCRLWDVNSKVPRYHKTCVKLRGYTGMKNPATTCCFSRDGYLIFAAGRDGCINMWDTRRKLVVPTATIKNAHARNSDTFAIANSHSGYFVTSRGEDSVVNIWDTRKLTTTLWKDSSFGAKYNTTDLTFSPDDKYLVIPTLPGGQTGRDKNETLEYSELRFLSMTDFTCKDEDTIKFPGDLVIRTAWNHRINQIFCTFSSGNYSIAYDLNTSHRGALLCHGKGPKKQRKTEMVEDFSSKIIITPNALPMFKTDKPRNKHREEMKARLDPTKSKRPELPITAGTMGRVGTSGSTLSSYVIRNLGMSKSVLDDMDPREAILRYAKDAAENPIWVTPAYQKTQPTPIFQKEEADEAPDAKKPKIL